MLRAPRHKFLLISIGAHLCVGLLIAVAAGRSAAPIASRSAVMELELVQPAVSPLSRQVEGELQSQPRHHRPSTRPIKRAAAHRPRRQITPPVTPAPPPMRLAMRGLELDLDPTGLQSAPNPAGGSGRSRRRERPAPDIQQRLDELLAADQARRNVELGNVDPVLYDIGRSAERRLAPDWSLTRSDRHNLGGVGPTSKELLRVLGRTYADLLQQHRDAYREPAGGREREPSMTQVLSNAMHGERTSDRGVALTCEVCVELTPGAKLRLTFGRRSGRRDFDRLARGALLRAARLRANLRPMAQARRNVRACYHLAARFFRLPPMPFVGGTFDENNLSAELYYPLKKLIRVRVKLLTARYL